VSELLKKEKAERNRELMEEDWRVMRIQTVGSSEEERNVSKVQS
jgi:hypothetical protein